MKNKTQKIFSVLIFENITTLNIKKSINNIILFLK